MLGHVLVGLPDSVDVFHHDFLDFCEHSGDVIVGLLNEDFFGLFSADLE